MNPEYEVSTINGKMLGFGEPLRVKQGRTGADAYFELEPDGGALGGAGGASSSRWWRWMGMRCRSRRRCRCCGWLRRSGFVRWWRWIAPGVWVLGEVRKHVQAAGMGMVVEYAGARELAADGCSRRTLSWEL